MVRFPPGIYSFNNINSSAPVAVTIDDETYNFAGGVIITSIVRNYCSCEETPNPMIIRKIGKIDSNEYNAPSILGNVNDKS